MGLYKHTLVWGLLYCLLTGCKDSEIKHDDSSIIMDSPFALEIKESLNQHIQHVSTTLASNPEVIAALNTYNHQHQSLKQTEIKAMDDQWQQKDESYAVSLIDANCSKIFIDYQKKNNQYKEIFVTSMTGLNVCQTNKTTDYYQADEAWWHKAFEAKTAYIGVIEYDESATTESIPIYVPVYDAHDMVGIMKVIVSINAMIEGM